MDFDTEIKNSNSLERLRNTNQQILGRKFHEHTHILWDIRTLLGPKEKTYCEIGSYVGSSASLMLCHPLPTRIVCIDPLNLNRSHYKVPQFSQQELLERNLRTISPNCTFTIHKALSEDSKLLQKLQTEQFKIDILFIDGNHRTQAVVNDFLNYYKFVNEGGYIVFDDYNDQKHSPGVKHGVHKILELIENDELPFCIIGNPINYQGALPRYLTTDDRSNEFVLKRI